MIRQGCLIYFKPSKEKDNKNNIYKQITPGAQTCSPGVIYLILNYLRITIFEDLPFLVQIYTPEVRLSAETLVP